MAQYQPLAGGQNAGATAGPGMGIGGQPQEGGPPKRPMDPYEAMLRARDNDIIILPAGGKKGKKQKKMSDRDWGWFQKGKDRKKSERMPKDGLYPKRYRAYSKGAWFIEMAYGSVMLLLPWYMRYFLYLPVFPTALAVGLFYLMIGISEQCVHQFAPYTSVTGLGRRVPWYILGNLICMIGFVALWIYPPSVNERDFQGYFFTPVQQIYWYVPWAAVVGIGYGMAKAAHETALWELTLYYNTRETLIHHMDVWEKIMHLLILSLAIVLWTFVPSQVNQFRYMMYAAAGLGAFTTGQYLWYVREVEVRKLAAVQYQKFREQVKAESKDRKFTWEALLHKYPRREQEKINPGEEMDWKHWVTEGSFYLHGIIYVSVRFCRTIYLFILPFFVIEIMQYEGMSILPTPLPVAVAPICFYMGIVYYRAIPGLIFKEFEFAKNYKVIPMFMGCAAMMATGIWYSFVEPYVDPPTDQAATDKEDKRFYTFVMAGLCGWGVENVMDISTVMLSQTLGHTNANNWTFVQPVYHTCYRLLVAPFLLFIMYYSMIDIHFLRWTLVLLPTTTGGLIFICACIILAKYPHRTIELPEKDIFGAIIDNNAWRDYNRRETEKIMRILDEFGLPYRVQTKVVPKDPHAGELPARAAFFGAANK